jgi:hypothetical protein
LDGFRVSIVAPPPVSRRYIASSSLRRRFVYIYIFHAVHAVLAVVASRSVYQIIINHLPSSVINNQSVDDRRACVVVEDASIDRTRVRANERVTRRRRRR